MEGTRAHRWPACYRIARIFTRVLVQARRLHYARCRLCSFVLSHNRARPRPPVRGRHGRRVLQDGARGHEGDDDSMDRVMSRSRARRLLLVIALAGGVGLLSSLAPWSVGVAESRTPVIKPVEEPRAGNPDDPDFSPLYHGGWATSIERPPREVAVVHSGDVRTLKCVMRGILLHMLRVSAGGRR